MGSATDRLAFLSNAIMQLPGYAEEEIRVIIICDCAHLGIGATNFLHGYPIQINYCMLAYRARIHGELVQDLLEYWAGANQVIIVYGCPFGLQFSELNV